MTNADLTRDELLDLLRETGALVAASGEQATIYVVGGAAMSLVHSARRVTRDVDAAITDGRGALLDAAATVAGRHGLAPDWFNTTASAFMSNEEDTAAVELTLPGLRMLVASPEHLIAMKLRALRDRDIDDLDYLFRLVGIATPAEAAAIHDRLFGESDIGYQGADESLYAAQLVFDKAARDGRPIALSADNPFASAGERPWGLPDFEALTAAHYREAFEVGMATQVHRLRVLATDSAPASVENVLGAWEDARRGFAQAKQVFHAVRAADTTPELDELAASMAARFAAHNDAIYMDAELYARLQALRARAEAGVVELDEQDDWALAELERSFVASGVLLDDAGKARLRELNAALAQLSTAFERNNRDARNAGAVTTSSGERIELINTSQQPALACLGDRGDLQRVLEASLARANGGEFDNRQIIVNIARARAERANLLGYPHHAALVASQGTAKTAGNVVELLVPIAHAALEAAKDEARELEQRLRRDDPEASLQPWDWAWLTQRVRAEKFGFDEADLAGFLDVHRVLEAVFEAASSLYGITFTPRPEVRGHTADAQAWQVDDADGTPVGLFIMDLYARPTKNGGAWMNSLVVGSQRYGELPVVTNNCNYSRDTKVISWTGVITMFHEFGHALHGLFAANRYPSRSGTAVPRDFVEFPSQVNEWWAWQPGRVLSARWLEVLSEAERFGSGFATLEAVMSALLDQSWHQASLGELPTRADEVDDFEAAAIESWGLANPWIPPRYRSTYFSHIWGGGYAAGYYGYTWSEVMDADAVAWFEANGGGTRVNGDHFRATLLAPGGSVDPAETYRRFRGRDPEVAPLLVRLGFAPRATDQSK